MQQFPGSVTISFSFLWRALVLSLLVFLSACGQGTPGYKESANANLVNLEIRNAKGVYYFDRNFDRDITNYRLTVDSSQEELFLYAAAEDVDASIEINGQPDMANRVYQSKLSYGENPPIEIVVTAPDGATKRIYTITVLRPDATVARLLSLKLESNASVSLSPKFHPDTFSYEATVPYGQKSLSISFTTDPYSEVTVDGVKVQQGTPTMSKELNIGSNYFLIKVLAQDGVHNQTYHLKVTREDSNVQKQNDRLKSLSVSGYDLDKAFSPSVFSYSLQVPNMVTSLTVSALAQNTNASVTINGQPLPPATTAEGETVAGSKVVPLELGTHSIVVKVVSEDGKNVREYSITYTRAARTESRLQTLTLLANNAELKYGFKSETTSYSSINVANGVTSVTLRPVAVDEVALVEVNGSLVARGGEASISLPNVGTYDIKVKVIAQDRSVTRTYIMAVQRVPLTDVSLSAITLPPELGFTFDPDQSNFSLIVPNERTNLVLSATLNDASSSLKINGVSMASGANTDYLGLQVGQNLIEVAVTGKYGINTQLYSLTITREGSGVAELSSLALNLTGVDLGFQPAKLTYDLSVPHAKGQLVISAQSLENAAIVVRDSNGETLAETNGSWTVNLAVGLNSVTLLVTAQNGADRLYTLNLTRAGSDNANLASLTASFGAYSPAFDPATTQYSASVSNQIADFSLQAVTQHANASIQLKADGLNRNLGDKIALASGVAKTVDIIVTAEDGSSSRTYQLTVTREQSGNARLSSLNVEGKTLIPAFSADIDTYALSVANADSAIRVTASTASPAAKLFVNGVATASGTPSTPVALQVGVNNQVKVSVQSEDGLNTQLYTLNVTRAASSNTDITQLATSQGNMSYQGMACMKSRSHMRWTAFGSSLPWGMPVPTC